MEIAGSVGSVLAHKGSRVWSIAPNSMVFDAIQLMADKNVGELAGGRQWSVGRNDLRTRLYTEGQPEGQVLEGHSCPGNYDAGSGHRDAAKMPGHWLLLRLGKRVLRPGGLELTRRMLNDLNIQPNDDVVEFGPRLGVTARFALARNPHSYVGVERDENAARIVRHYLHGDGHQCLIGSAEETGLPNAQASVVYGEAMLTMQGQRQKAHASHLRAITIVAAKTLMAVD